MSKKGKEKKVDASLFFQSQSTGIPDIVSSHESGDVRGRRFDARENFEGKQRFQNQDRFERPLENNERESSWRKGSSSNNLSNSVDDKWGNGNRQQSRSTNDFRSHDSSSQSDKWSSAFSKSSSSNLKGSYSNDSLKSGSSDNDLNSNIEKMNLNKSNSSISIQEAQLIKEEDSSDKSIASLQSTASKAKQPQQSAQKIAKLEAARKAKEAKELLEEKARREKEEEEKRDLASIASSKLLLDSSLKGAALVEHWKGLQVDVSGSTFVSEILKSLIDPLSLKWCSKSEYGECISKMLHQNTRMQVRTLHAIQTHCNQHKFPKITVKDSKRNFIEVLFQLLYQYDIIDTNGFLSWKDDESDIPGKINALLQTNSFFEFLNEDDDADEEEEEEEEIDAPLPTIP